MVGVAEPDALQDGDVVTAEDHDTPGPDTVQVAFWPFTPVALHESATDCPVRTRSGVAVMVRSVAEAVHQPAPTETSGHCAEPEAFVPDTCMP